MKRLRIPIMIFFTVAISGVFGFILREDTHLVSRDLPIQILAARMVDSSPVAASVGGGFVDRQYFIEPNIHVIEGWAILPRRGEFPRISQTLQVYSTESSKLVGAFQYQRQDLPSTPGSRGFIIYGLTSKDSGKPWCVVVPSENTLLELGGVNC